MSEYILENKYVKIDKKTLTGTGAVYECISINSGNRFYIVSCPTCNCQISSIAACENIILEKDFVNILESLQEKGYISKQLLVDIHQSSKYNKIIRDGLDVVFQNNYTSTNGSEMSIYLIKLGIEEEYDD